MMTCKEAARLVSEKKDHALPWRKRFGLRMHLALCRMCRRYQEHLEMISRLASAAGERVLAHLPLGDVDDFALPGPAKERMKQRLKNAQRQ